MAKKYLDPKEDVALRKTLKFAFCAAAVLGVSTAEGAFRAWEPRDYAQDGLALHYDGIRNAGADAAHDSHATEWKDLSASGNDLTLHYYDGEGGVGDGLNGERWNSDGFDFDAYSYGVTENPQNIGTVYTVQLLCDANKTALSNLGFPTAALFFSAGAMNQGSVWAKNNSQVQFWADGIVGTDWDSRSRLGSATWKYITAARNGEKTTLTESASLPADDNLDKSTGWAVGNKNVSAGSQNLFVGGRSSSADSEGKVWRDNGYMLKGAMKSVRVYGRLLTDEEMAWNRALDEARFFGNAVCMISAQPVASAIPDAVVATSLPGAEGLEACGSYAVDEENGHVFSAVSAVVGGTSYACTGYTLEAWNAAAGTWGAPVPHSGEYSCAVAAGDKVRITWQWGAAAGTLAPDTSAYVQNGLVMHFDGIRNTGANAEHDCAATVWKDLSGSCNDLAMRYYDGEGVIHDGLQDGCWTDDGFYFDGASFGATVRNQNLGTNYTVEILCDADMPTQQALNLPNGGAFFCTDNMANGSVWYKKDTRIQFWANNTVGTVWDTRSQLPEMTWKYVTAVRRGDRTTLFSGTSLPADDNLDRGTGWAVGTKSTSAGSVRWYVGGCTCVGTDYTNNKGYCLKGFIKSVRVYDRVLTDEELAQNREIDEARFGTVRIPGPGSVTVAESLHGCVGREHSGVYVADGWTFSSGIRTNTLVGISWACDGCTVQTWNSETQKWGDATELSVTEWTAPSGTDYAPRRLTWHWKPVHGVRSAASYDVADYVRGSVMLHLDGIRNVGADAAHDSSATMWADLSGNGRDAMLNVADDGSGNVWSANGFFFNASADFHTTAAFALGTQCTMEFLADVSYTSQGTGTFGTFIAQYGGVNKGSVLIKRGDSTLLYQTDDLIGNVWDTRPGFYQPPRISRLVTARDGQKACMFTGVEYPTNTENEKANARCIGWSYGTVCNVAAASRWTVGGYRDANGSSATNRYLKGTIKSVRVYNRLLTEDELAWNHKVDEARFFGNLSVTNVVVAGKFDNYAGDAPGAYEVFGSHTFTASDVTDNKGKLRKVLGYTVQAWEGSDWGEAVEYSGGSYEHVVGTSPAKVLLTWQWQSAGTMVIFR